MGETRPPHHRSPSRGIGVWLLIGLALVLIGTLGLIWLPYLSQPARPEPTGMCQLARWLL